VRGEEHAVSGEREWDPAVVDAVCYLADVYWMKDAAASAMVDCLRDGYGDLVVAIDRADDVLYGLQWDIDNDVRSRSLEGRFSDLDALLFLKGMYPREDGS
jgi:hypothetical protein